MSWVMPDSSVINAYMCFMVWTVLPISSDCFSMSAMRSFISFMFCSWPTPCMLIRNGIEVCSIGVPCGRVIACTREMPGTWNTALAILLMTRKSAEFRMSWSVSISSISGFIRD
ncbi:hypothetical protein C1Y40_03916 [Mycobacterium talmoniae]|uniref:Uncharacterized protein n=1 Tax=Mycobacterium talmoniae TaxID=1858794 RepID=A0A2S8BH26_9MYCO|nr:hypothetical protein C1Y40_03916 [Mycobacterium talmoniae]